MYRCTPERTSARATRFRIHMGPGGDGPLRDRVGQGSRRDEHAAVGDDAQENDLGTRALALVRLDSCYTGRARTMRRGPRSSSDSSDS
jgi:hypothetical protein